MAACGSAGMPGQASESRPSPNPNPNPNPNPDPNPNQAPLLNANTQGGAAHAALHAALAAIKELRLSMAKLPPAQMVPLRAECNALLAALDAHGVPHP